MGPGVALFIAELVKIGIQHLEARGKFNSLTEDEAKAEAQKIAATLQVDLPSFADLQKQ